MTARIDLNMPAAAYHAAPGLSASGAWKIHNDCPAAYRFGPPHESRAMDVGSATHCAILEPDAFDSRYLISPFDDFRKKDAREWRDSVEASGGVVLRADDVDVVDGVRRAIAGNHYAANAFRDGVPEASIFWTDNETGVECRARPDWLPNGAASGPVFIPDLKTARTAKPEAWMRAAMGQGAHVSAAMICDGVEALHGHRPHGLFFVVVEKVKPFLVSTIMLPPEVVELGRRIMRKSLRTYAECLSSDKWPGYADGPVMPPAPGWIERDLEEVEDGKFSGDDDDAADVDWFAAG